MIPPAFAPWVWTVRSFFPYYIRCVYICLKVSAHVMTARTPPFLVETTAANGPAWRCVTFYILVHFVYLYFRDVTTSAATTETAGARKTTVITARTLSSSPSSRRSRRESARLGTSRTAMTAKASAPRYI